MSSDYMEIYNELRQLNSQLQDGWEQEADIQHMLARVLRERADAMSTLLVKHRVIVAGITEGLEILPQRIAVMERLLYLAQYVEPQYRLTEEAMSMLAAELDRVRSIRDGLAGMMGPMAEETRQMENTLAGYVRIADHMRDTMQEYEQAEAKWREGTP